MSRIAQIICRLLAAAGLLLLPVGCNTYSENFVSSLGDPHPEPADYAQHNIRPAAQPPQLIVTPDIYQTSLVKQAEGYAVLSGAQSFWIPASADKAVELGKKIKAELVLVERFFRETQHRTRTRVDYEETDMKHVDTSVDKQGNRRKHEEEITHRTPVHTVEHYTVDVYDHHAVYLARWATPPPLGAGVRNLTREERIDLGIRHGVEILFVSADSPASNAGLLPGDILLEINDTDVSSKSAYTLMMRDYRSQRVTLALLRRNEPLLIDVQLR